MKYIDLTLPSPAANLAADEVLLDSSEDGSGNEVLRFWEARTPFVVVGYANRAATEVNLESCQAGDIPVLRRLSGGGTVLQGPGCLNYSLILRIEETGPLSSITGANQFIMEQQKAALEPLVGSAIVVKGCTDLAIDNLKFSGNAQRRKRKFLIFHGTFLLNFDISLIEKYLRMPSKEPDYRQGRKHGSFLTNLKLSADPVKCAIRERWRATDSLSDIPTAKIDALGREKYSTDEWNFRF